MTAHDLVACALGLIAGILLELAFGRTPCRRACCVADNARRKQGEYYTPL